MMLLRTDTALPRILAMKFDLLVGFDTEYVTSTIIGEPNRLLSYQLHVLNAATGMSSSQWFRPSGSRRAQRLSMAAVLRNAVKIAEEKCGYIRPGNNTKIKIALAGHFSRADMPGFSDFKKWKRHIVAIRGTFASTLHPMVTDMRFHGGRVHKASVTLFDTMLLAAAGSRKLEALGEALGRKKLSVPDVVDEAGKTVPGIGRMDLVLKQHRREYIAYALRDAEITVLWLCVAANFAERMGLSKKMSPTIASIAVNAFIGMHTPEVLGATLGYDTRDPKGRSTTPRLTDVMLPKIAGVLSLLANSYHGGRNEAFMAGEVHAPGDRPWRDVDVRGAYSTALAFFRPLDWENMQHTEDLDRLATLNVLTVAQVTFEFPEGTRNPSLPVDGGERGLIYPLSGRTTCTGAELLVACNQGCRIRVDHGLLIPWLDQDGVRPFVEFARLINTIRSEHPKGSPIEKLAKEAGNSLYGKLGQGVGAWKSTPVNRVVFNMKEGEHEPLGPCKITSPLLASYTSGLPRALLSEILARIPEHVRVISVTTDGILSDATEAEMKHALDGPVTRHFRSLRKLVDAEGSDQVTDLKHEALSVLSVRTRGAFTLIPHNGSELIVTRCGHHTEETFTDDAEERDYWVDIVRNKPHGHKIKGEHFICVSDQWHADSDLIKEPKWVRVAFDYDFKRIPVDPRDVNGRLAFDTRPWPNVVEFDNFRDELGRWRNKSQSRVNTVDTLERFMDARTIQNEKSNKGTVRRTPLQNNFIAAWASGTYSELPIRIKNGRGRNVTIPTYEDAALILTDAGVPDVTREVFKHNRARKTHLDIKPAPVYVADLPVLRALLETFDDEIFEQFMDDEGWRRFLEYL